MLPELAKAPVFFVLAATLWGLSAFVSRDQALAGGPEFSVGLRMALVSLFMFLYCKARNLDVFISKENWLGVLSQGIFFFSLGFILFYYSTIYIPSGISALLLALSAVISCIIAALFLSQPVSRLRAIGILIAVTGVAILFLPEVGTLFVAHPGAGGLSIKGLVIGCMAALSTAVGTVFGARNQAHGIPIPVCMAWGAAVGAAASVAAWAINPEPVSITVSLSYVFGLAYLSLFASCVAFFLYFDLVHRIGPGSATSVLATVPLIAIIVSILFEGLQISWQILVGGLTIIAGNSIVLTSRSETLNTINTTDKTQ